ncbi:MAG TPA: Wzz/FepE/Etk N-terminal domain-containing protein [Terriglobia bacterium]|nr:Wzz/FepE/Etk N-terminal domain-containing protein [Terriglobia bacterium]
MAGEREMSFEDYLGILHRRRWVVLIPAIVGPLVGYLVTLLLTPQYTSTSLVLIEQPTVPSSFVQSVSEGDLFTRLATMQEQIESRTRLQPIIERYDLYKSERRRSMEDALDQMRKDIQMLPVQFSGDMAKAGANKQQPVPGFSISFTASTAKLAQQVCTELTSMFMEENLQQREQRAQGTTDFLSSQLADAKRALDEQNAKLADFKRKNLGSLPEDQAANLQVLTSLNSQLDASTEQLSRAQQEKTYLESLLSQQVAAWQSETPVDDQDPDKLKDQLAKMKEGLAVMEGRYTNDYPDVIKMKKDIAQLEAHIQDLEQAKSTKASTPAQAPVPIQQLRAQLTQDEELIKAKTAEQDDLQKKIRAYEARVQVSPLVEQQYKELSLGQDGALKFYNSLAANRDQSQMSASLESRGQGEQFRVLDSADLPQDPSFPVWWQFALGGFGVGLGAGAGLAILAEFRDKAIRDERDVTYYLDLPTLALVPSVESANGRKNDTSKPSGSQEELQPREPMSA